jgi:hypothetical protein
MCEELLAAAGILCRSSLTNCTQIIQFTAAELRKQLQNSARYEIRVSVSQPLSFVSISQPYHLPLPVFMFPFHNVPFSAPLLHSVAYQDFYAFNFRLGRLQSFVSKANNFFYLSLAFMLPEALHSLAQQSTMLSADVHYDTI